MRATCSSVLVLPRSSWCVWAVNRRAPPQPARMRPARAARRACSSFRACTACRALRGRGLRLRVRVFACVRLARAACVRAGACGLELLVCAGVFACERRACVRVRLACVRVCLRLRVRSRCSSRQLRFLRRAFGRRVAGEFVVEVRGGSEAEESVH
jgi:hypothetical protein